MAASRVLIVDTPAGGLWSLAARLRADGLEVLEVHTSEAALGAVGSGVVGVLLVHRAATIDVTAVLAQARDVDPDVGVLAILDGENDAHPPGALGQADIIRFPCDLHELARRVGRETAGARHRRQLRAWQMAAGVRLGADALIGESEPMARIRTVIRKLSASVGVATLVTGESGTGRTRIARIVHDTSERRAQPFVRVDCTQRPSLPAELFGTDDAPGGGGAVEWADEGTLLLADVDRLTPDLQVALLRTLEEGLFRRVGSSFDRATNVRVVASTALDLDAEVQAGRFRRDLYYRLSVVRLDPPPLRHRGRDVLLLAAHFAASAGAAPRAVPIRIDEAAAESLLRYDWPGNVRELQHVTARAVLLSSGDVVTAADVAMLDPAARPASEPFVLPAGGVNLDDLERRLVIEALSRTGGNQTRAAELLGLHRDQIRYRMLKYGLRR
jgi:two-component system response regulator AtoC